MGDDNTEMEGFRFWISLPNLETLKLCLSNPYLSSVGDLHHIFNVLLQNSRDATRRKSKLWCPRLKHFTAITAEWDSYDDKDLLLFLRARSSLGHPITSLFLMWSHLLTRKAVKQMRRYVEIVEDEWQMKKAASARRKKTERETAGTRCLPGTV